MDLFDPKPKLNELDGEPLPDSLLEDVKFAFIQKESARLMGSPRTFEKYGQCGMDISDLLPHLTRVQAINFRISRCFRNHQIFLVIYVLLLCRSKTLK